MTILKKCSRRRTLSVPYRTQSFGFRPLRQQCTTRCGAKRCSDPSSIAMKEGDWSNICWRRRCSSCSLRSASSFRPGGADIHSHHRRMAGAGEGGVTVVVNHHAGLAPQSDRGHRRPQDHGYDRPHPCRPIRNGAECRRGPVEFLDDASGPPFAVRKGLSVVHDGCDDEFLRSRPRRRRGIDPRNLAHAARRNLTVCGPSL